MTLSRRRLLGAGATLFGLGTLAKCSTAPVAGATIPPPFHVDDPHPISVPMKELPKVSQIPSPRERMLSERILRWPQAFSRPAAPQLVADYLVHKPMVTFDTVMPRVSAALFTRDHVVLALPFTYDAFQQTGVLPPSAMGMDTSATARYRPKIFDGLVNGYFLRPEANQLRFETQYRDAAGVQHRKPLLELQINSSFNEVSYLHLTSSTNHSLTFEDRCPLMYGHDKIPKSPMIQQVSSYEVLVQLLVMPSNQSNVFGVPCTEMFADVNCLSRGQRPLCIIVMSDWMSAVYQTGLSFDREQFFLEKPLDKLFYGPGQQGTFPRIVGLLHALLEARRAELCGRMVYAWTDGYFDRGQIAPMANHRAQTLTLFEYSDPATSKRCTEDVRQHLHPKASAGEIHWPYWD
jgi:hypothetical protein